MALTEEEKRENRISKMIEHFRGIGPGKQKSLVARSMQKAIRMEAADEFGRCTCVTCGKKHHYKCVHAGHFIAGRSNGVLFDERGVHVQCVRCNTYLGGNQEKYAKYMLDNYGQEVIEELERNRGSNVSFTVQELVEMRVLYMDRIKVQEKRLADSGLNWE